MRKSRQFAFQVIVLGCHLLDAVVSLPSFLDHVTFVTPRHLEFAAFIVTCKVFLQHLEITTVMGAHDSGEVTLFLVPGELIIGDACSAALVSILTTSLDLGQGFDEQGVRLLEFEVLSTAVRTANNVFPCDHLPGVVVNACLAETFATLTAFPRCEHHSLAEDAVQVAVILLFRGSRRL